MASLSFVLSGCALADAVAPPESMMARAEAGLQRILLSPLEADSPIFKAGWQMDNLSAVPAAAAIQPKFGATALTLSGKANRAGAKGDFTLSDFAPGETKTLGVWVFLAPDSNVDKLGFQLYDGEGEALIVMRSADWTGWKWVEWPLNDATIEPAYKQADKNGKADFPLKSVHLAWFSKAAGQSSLTIDALIASTKLDADAKRPALTTEVGGASWAEPNGKMAAQLLFTNFSDKAQNATVEYSLQRDSQLLDAPLPDPIYGSDHALEATDWTEYDGKRIAERTLTDNDEHTSAELPWGGNYLEAFQTMDLGRERKVSHLAYVAGDANWVNKVDISASTDGKNYQPVAGLQNLDWNKKWQRQQIKVPQPFAARFIRLRYHNGGEAVKVIRMPLSFSVYDGVADETWKFPQSGEEIAKGTQKTAIAAHDFAPLDLQSDKALATGAYRLNVRIEAGGQTQLLARPFYVMPPKMENSPNLRLGLNASQVQYAPLHKRLGIGWVRFENLKWPMVSPSEGVYKFDGVAPWNVMHDEIFQTYRANDLQVLPFLFNTPKYATTAPADAKKSDIYPPKDLNQYGEFVFQTVARYGSQKHPASELKTADKKSGLGWMDTFELWNEPNLINTSWGAWATTLDDYYAMFRPGAEAVKRADPKARVTNGGFAGVEIDTIDTLRSYQYPDGKTPLDFVDVLNAHFYTGRVPPEQATLNPNIDRSANPEPLALDEATLEYRLRALDEWRDRYKPQIPIWITETGYDTAGPYGIGDRLQAARLPRAIMLALGNGVEKVIVYREKGDAPGQHAAAGVLRNDETLKPSWFSYATLIRELNGTTGGQRLPVADANVRVFAWPKGDKIVLSAWAVEGSAEIPMNLGRATVSDAFGNKTTGAVSKLSLSEFPIYISDISDLSAVKVLQAQATKDAATRKTELAKLEKLRAYLFDFGTTEHVGTLQLGSVRRFIPLGKDAAYDEKLGYGFTPHAPDKINDAHWIKSKIERDSLRIAGDMRFQIKAEPGRYLLQINATPPGNGEQQIEINGAQMPDGSANAFTFSKDKPLIETEVTIGNEPLTVAAKGHTDLHWLTLIEKK